MGKPPDRVYLRFDATGIPDVFFCADMAREGDVEYIRADIMVAVDDAPSLYEGRETRRARHEIGGGRWGASEEAEGVGDDEA